MTFPTKRTGSARAVISRSPRCLPPPQNAPFGKRRFDVCIANPVIFCYKTNRQLARVPLRSGCRPLRLIPFPELASSDFSSSAMNRQLNVTPSPVSSSMDDCKSLDKDFKLLSTTKSSFNRFTVSPPKTPNCASGEMLNDTYKTRWCRNAGGACPFLNLPGGCQFAHSEKELRRQPERVAELNAKRLVTMPPPKPHEALDVPLNSEGIPVAADYRKKCVKEEHEKWIDQQIPFLEKIFGKKKN
ncbi:hypothetical protein L596_017950 [Steinernema carpocapsae]|uniref:C3H1-type domain-containing protein n=1 Tax=Steinernema carpocapsae TaxID=34508 RepID=A0A4U5N3H5_STECR|nr:hypothetical protein L596_017950 [Steinernema carpocapsae]